MHNRRSRAGGRIASSGGFNASDSRCRTFRGPAPALSLWCGYSAALSSVPRLPPTVPGDAGPRGRAVAALAVECTPIPKCPILRVGAVTASKHQQGMPGLMLTALILIVLAAIALVLILLAVIVAGIRQEPHSAELSDVAPSPIAVLVRHLTGLYVRRPTPTADRARGQGEGNPAGPRRGRRRQLHGEARGGQSRCRRTQSSK
jgi:hypothetical protein